MTMENYIDQNLIWLQKFYTTKIHPLQLSLPKVVEDNQIDLYNPFKNFSLLPGMLKIEVVSNPGWALDFCYYGTICENEDWVEVAVNLLETEDDGNWFSSYKKEETFSAVGGPLYLSVALEAF